MEQQGHRATSGAPAASESEDPGKSVEGARRPYGRYTALLVLAIGCVVVSTYVSAFLVQGDQGEPTEEKLLADPERLVILHQRPTKYAPPPATETNLTDAQSSRLYEVIKKNLRHTDMPNASSLNENGPDEFGEDSWVWANAGGEFGLSGDWRAALLTATSGESLRGDRCSGADSQKEVQRILDRRNRTPPNERVAACVRTKDFGRYLPEWIAYHYAIGVDEMVIYDDDSVDGTKEILRPFVGAGIVSYVFFKVKERALQMRPLNDCLMRLKRRRASKGSSPKWILFHDTDEYIFPGNTERSISEALELYDRTCCLQVKRVQYGSSGYRETPRGLVIDNFLRHATVRDAGHNRLPKVVVNLNPAHPELGVISSKLRSMHDGAGCKCDVVSSKDVLINHYLGSVGDFVDKTKRYWQSNHSLNKVEKYMKQRDINTVRTDTITDWGCATREILARIDEKVDLRTGFP